MAEKNEWDNEKTKVAGANPNFYSSKGKVYEIHVTGQLDSRWSEWLEGLEIKNLENGEMALTGPIADQAALMGLLNKLGRLNLELRSVNEIETKEGLEPK